MGGMADFPGQGTLESWPFGILGPAHFKFVLDWILCVLPAVKAEREGVHLWPELSNLEVIGKKLR